MSPYKRTVVGKFARRQSFVDNRARLGQASFQGVNDIIGKMNSVYTSLHDDLKVIRSQLSPFCKQSRTIHC